MKTCPYCAEDIQDAAVKCKHCGEWLNDAAPVAPAVKKAVPAEEPVQLVDLWIVAPGNPAAMTRNIRTLLPDKSDEDVSTFLAACPALFWDKTSRAKAQEVRGALKHENPGAYINVVDVGTNGAPAPPVVAPRAVATAPRPTVRTPSCPTCGSTRIYHIGGGRKVARFALIGPFALPKAVKSFQCRNCKARW